MGTGLIIIISIIGYLLMWLITSCLWFIVAIQDYKEYRRHTPYYKSFHDWYQTDDRDAWVAISGLLWPITLIVGIVWVILPLITNCIKQRMNI